MIDSSTMGLSARVASAITTAPLQPLPASSLGVKSAAIEALNEAFSADNASACVGARNMRRYCCLNRKKDWSVDGSQPAEAGAHTETTCIDVPYIIN